MAPLIYPEPTWSNRFGRVVRTLQVVAVAGAIGAVGGGVAVMALVGGGSSSRQPTALKVSTADNAGGPANGAAPAVPQPNAAAATAQANPSLAPAAVAAAEAGTQQQTPAAPEPSSNEAATAQHPVEQAAAPADAAAGTHVYNRVEPEQKAAPAQAPRARAKVTRPIKNTEHGRRERGVPYPAENSRYSDERGARYSGERGYSDQRGGPYSGERYSYRDYDPPPVVRAPPPAPRGYYFGGGGGGVFYDHGGWGD